MIFDKTKGKLGFGCMRLPMLDNEIDKEQFNRMIDAFIGAGFNYFDTAHGYIEGKSELAIRDCLSARYHREDFVLANKLRTEGVSAETDICGRSLKAQMKYADKAGAKYVIVVGDNEIDQNEAELRDMRGGSRVKVALSASDIIKQIG